MVPVYVPLMAVLAQLPLVSEAEAVITTAADCRGSPCTASGTPVVLGHAAQVVVPVAVVLLT